MGDYNEGMIEHRSSAARAVRETAEKKTAYMKCSKLDGWAVSQYLPKISGYNPTNMHKVMTINKGEKKASPKKIRKLINS